MLVGVLALVVVRSASLKAANPGLLTGSTAVKRGISVAPHIGYQKVSHNSDFSYTDFSLGVSKDFSGLVVSATAVYADVKKFGGVPAYVGPNGKNLGRASVVLGVKYNF